jgi:mutual gliding-motility protein MglA
MSGAMAFYDPATQSITLRIVYDGLGTAGKTTNIRQIYEFFSPSKRSNIYIPEEYRGRTLFFDWLELEAGQLDGHRLRVQLITVPGQFSYAQRRWRLLRDPDAIVAIVDSTPQGLTRARYAMDFLRAALAQSELDVPVIVQANKQDLDGSVRAGEVARRLGIDGSMRVVEAIAARGDGVRATLVFAIHAAQKKVRERILREGITSLPGAAETAEQVYLRMLRDEEDNADGREGELLLDALLQSSPTGNTPVPPQAPPEPPPADPPPRPSVAASVAGVTRRSSRPPVAVRRSSRPPAAAALPESPPEADDLEIAAPLMVWPAAGKQQMRELEAQPARHLRREWESFPGDAAERTFLYESGGPFVLLTRRSFVFADLASAAARLRALAEARTTAGQLLPSSVVLAILPERESSACRLWYVRPALAPLLASTAQIDPAATPLIAHFVARSLGLAVRHGVVLPLDPTRLARDEAGVVSLDVPLRGAPLGPWVFEGLLRYLAAPDTSRFITDFFRAFREAMPRYLAPGEAAQSAALDLEQLPGIVSENSTIFLRELRDSLA